MNALLLYPHFPRTFWSFDRFLEMAGRVPLRGVNPEARMP
jgi:hypothetical protein